jgi:two-component system nitrogen regulation response regulator GlnG
MSQNLKVIPALCEEQTSTDNVVSMVQQQHPSYNRQGGLSGMVESFLRDYFIAHQGTTPAAGLYDRVIREVERPLLKLTLKSVACNQKKAAQILGINRNTLRKKIQELNIDLCEL